MHTKRWIQKVMIFERTKRIKMPPGRKFPVAGHRRARSLPNGAVIKPRSYSPGGLTINKGYLAGYTIIEVMIVLTVSAALFLSAVLLVSGQQAKTEFAQAIREIDSQIQDIINDTSTGFYPNTNNIKCDTSLNPNSGRPTIIDPGASPPAQGTNQECIFIGRVIQFAVKNTNPEGFNIYTIVGRREVGPAGSKTEAKDYNETVPTAIATGTGSTTDPLTGLPAVIVNTNIPNAFEKKTLTNGLKAKKVMYTDSSNTLKSVGAVGFLSGFGKYNSTSTNLLSGAQTVNLLPIPGTNTAQLSTQAADLIDLINNNTASSSQNPGGGVTICFESGGTNQYGVITLGSNGRQLSTKLDIYNKGSQPGAGTGNDVC